MRPDLLGLAPDELEALLADLGQPAYRARQLFSWLHHGTSFEEMSDLPASLRARLAECATAGSLRLGERLTARDGASKFGFHTGDSHLIETVLIPHANRNTVCVSSQIGCRYRCLFCATGKQGLTRDLTAGEIVEQVVRVQQAVRSGQGGVASVARYRSNVVFMGMGEPLENYDAVLKAVRLLNHPWGLHIAARHIAISTCGLPDGIRRLADEGLQVALAISLHAATDELRTRLVPVNRKYPLAELMSAAREYVDRTRRKVTFEWVVAPGLNDTPEQARALARSLMQAMVNLIPHNPPEAGKPATPSVARVERAIEGTRPADKPDPGPALAFAQRLRRLGLEVAVRRSRGGEVLGACGQLRERATGPNNIGRASARPME
jgi:23S rRNA (adenine2503-C2)-methyltransferase